jgi:HlyD family secretion protein
MDRPLDRHYRNWQMLRRASLIAAVVAPALILFDYAPRWLRPSLARDEIRTAVVETGPIEATISATGTVVPEFEQVLSSPLDARVLRILKRPGAVLTKAEPTAELDVSDSVLALEKLNQQLSLKENDQRQRKLELENTLIDLRRQLQLKEIDVQSLSIKRAKQEKLQEAGLNSEEQLREAQVDEEKAKVELKQLAESIRVAERSTEAKLDGLALEIETLRKERTQSQRQLELANAKADRGGVLTWMIEVEGSAVRKGDVIARIADLSSFRVEATFSDVHASRLTPGMPAKVQVNESTVLEGAILPFASDILRWIRPARDEGPLVATGCTWVKAKWPTTVFEMTPPSTRRPGECSSVAWGAGSCGDERELSPVFRPRSSGFGDCRSVASGRSQLAPRPEERRRQ